MTICRRGPGIVALATLLTLAACGGSTVSPAQSARDPRLVTVASFAFPESVTVAEIYAQTLEAAGLHVDRAFDLASREIVEPALEQGKVDLVPEYLGTALAFVDPGANGHGLSAEELRARAADAFGQRGITLLDPSTAQNQNGIAVLATTADRLHLAKVSDLAPLASQLAFGGPPECPDRPFCLKGLATTYGLRFKSFIPLDAGGPLSVGALETHSVDVALLFTSSARLAGDRFRLLQDDRGLQPPENLVPMVRTDTVIRNSAAMTARLNRVSAALTTSELVALNHRVEVERVSSAQAASDWLKRNGLS